MSIETRIQAINDHLVDDYKVLRLAGADLSGVNKNIVNLKMSWKERLLYFMNNGTDEVWNNWTKVSGTGTTLSLNNTEEAPMSLVYKGNTYQDSTSGKNILPNDLNTTTLYGITATKNSDGSITFTGTATGTSTFVLCENKTINIDASTYVLSTHSSGSYSSGNSYFNIYDNNNTQIMVLSNTNNSISKTFSSTSNLSKATIVFGNGCVIASGGFTIYPMLEKSNTPTSYEPYTGGIPAPNPDYPQDIHVVSGDNSIEVCGRNLGNPNTLFDEMYNSYVAKPTRTIVDNRNVISFSTYHSHNKPLYVTKYKENTQYTFRVVAKAAESALRYLYIIIDYTDGTKSSTSIPNQGTSWDELRIVSTANKTIKDFFFSYSNAGYWYIDEDSFNIIEGDTTDYETYKSAIYPVNLPVENILDITSSGSSIGGVPFTIENGIIKINGTTSSSTASYYFNTFRAKSESAVFSIEVTGYTDKSSGNSALILQQSDDGTTGWSTLSELSLNSIYAKQNSVTLDSSKYYRLRWYVDSNTFTNATIKAQLEYGNKKNSFTPYGTTPIELCKIGTYQDRFIRNSGKNLLEPSSFAQKVIDTPYSSANVSTYDNETGELSIKMGNSSVVFDNFKENTQYTIILKYNIATNGSNLQIAYTDNTTQNITPTAGSGIFRLVTTEGKSVASIKHSAYDSTTPRTLYLKESGIFEGVIETTDFEPYGNGEWYLEKKTGKVILDGSEDSWVENSATKGLFQITLSNVLSNLNTINAMANWLKGNTGINTANQTYSESINNSIATFNSNRLFFRINDYKENLAGLKTFLASNNLTAYYVLATPTYETITDTTLIGQLEALKKSYESVTNISQVNNDLPFELSVTALEVMS